MVKNYLMEKNGVPYFRMRVPTKLQKHMSGREIKYSLKGMDLQMAKSKCSLLGERLSDLFRKARTEEVIMAALHPLVKKICANILFLDGQKHISQLTGSDNTMMTHDWMVEHLTKFYQEQNMDNPIAENLCFYAQQLGVDAKNIKGYDYKSLVLDFYQALIETFRIQKERARGNLYNGYDEAMPDGRFSKILSPKDASPGLLEKENFTLTEIMSKAPLPESSAFNPLPHLEDAKLSNIEQQTTDSPQPAVLAVPQVSISPSVKTITLEEAIRDFLEEKSTNKRGLTPKTTRMYTSQLNILLEVLGNIDVGTIQRKNIINLMNDVLYKYPKHRAIKYKDKP